MPKLISYLHNYITDVKLLTFTIQRISFRLPPEHDMALLLQLTSMRDIFLRVQVLLVIVLLLGFVTRVDMFLFCLSLFRVLTGLFVIAARVFLFVSSS